MQVRKGSQPGRFIDLAYRDFTADPISEIRRIYTELGMPLKPDAEQNMRRYLEENPQHKHGRHRYRLEDFGLDPELEEERFADYRSHFGIAVE